MWNTSFDCHCVDVSFLNVVYALCSSIEFAIHLRCLFGEVMCRLCVSGCILTVSTALRIYSASEIVCSGGLFWLTPVVIVLFRLCSAVPEEWLLLKKYCVEMCGILFVIYGSSVFSRILLSLREVR